jgi:hypothetical protein
MVGGGVFPAPPLPPATLAYFGLARRGSTSMIFGHYTIQHLPVDVSDDSQVWTTELEFQNCCLCTRTYI